MPENLRGRVITGERMVGTLIGFPSPELVEIAGRAGYDYVLLDQEHAPLQGTVLSELIRAGTSVHVPVLVRVPEARAKAVLQALDLGATGVMIPMVESAGEAEAMVQATAYPPQGNRGFNPVVRAAGYGSIPAREYLEAARGRHLVILQVESRRGIEAVEEIAAVDGADVIFIAPVDLSLALGHPGELSHPMVERAIERIAEAARRHGRAVGAFVASVEQAEWFREKGASFLLTSQTVLIWQAMQGEVTSLRSGWPDDEPPGFEE